MEFFIMTSIFNPQAFLSTTIESALDTKFVPVPEGTYLGIVKNLKPRQLQDGRIVVDVNWIIDSADVRELTGQAEPLVRQGVWIDLTPEGNLDCGRGKNIGLGKLRESLGQNDETKEWSMDMMVGCVAMVKVTQSVNGTTGDINSNVSATTPIDD
jgi:hypothetical protein